MEVGVGVKVEIVTMSFINIYPPVPIKARTAIMLNKITGENPFWLIITLYQVFSKT